MKIYKFIGEDKDKNDFKNFMKEFVAKNKCKIIYKNKIIPLQSLLKQIIIFNMNSMFYNVYHRNAVCVFPHLFLLLLPYIPIFVPVRIPLFFFLRIIHNI